MTLFLKVAALSAYLLATAALSTLQIDAMLKAHYTAEIANKPGMKPLPAKAMEE